MMGGQSAQRSMMQGGSMMGQMSDLMKNMPAGNVKAVSEFMRQMSAQMMAMSNAMSQGNMTEGDLRSMQERMSQMQNMLSGIEKK